MSLTRRQAMAACAAAATGFAAGNHSSKVRLHRVPEGGIQPQAAVDDRGNLHLVYYTGDAHEGNLFYTRAANGGAAFLAPVAVNSRAGSAVAAGTIRGAQMALGKDARVHVAWNGSGANPPMVYTRLDGKSFEPERNVMLHSSGLNGGGSIAADRAGNVYVAWHAGGDEKGRIVWITKSQDEGRSFAAERKVSNEGTGVCGCCGMKIFATREGSVFGLYRSATEGIHRDIYLLSSTDAGEQFSGRLLDKWDINACPMTSMDIVQTGSSAVGAWENAGQIYWARLDSGKPVAAPGEGKTRKHPRIAVNKSGDMLLVWTEGTGWQRGGSFAWQVYDRLGQPTDSRGQMPGIPTWSFAAPAARLDGNFSILY